MLDTIADLIYKRLGPDWCGMPAPPPRKTLYFGPLDGEKRSLVASTQPNDGFELWLGTPDTWWGFMRMTYAKQLAWFILWDVWVVGSWFGLRRVLWYWALNRRCARYREERF